MNKVRYKEDLFLPPRLLLMIDYFVPVKFFVVGLKRDTEAFRANPGRYLDRAGFTFCLAIVIRILVGHFSTQAGYVLDGLIVPVALVGLDVIFNVLGILYRRPRTPQK